MGDRNAWCKAWQQYAERVIKRLRCGHREYGGTAASRDPLELCREIRDELADVAGWACWIDARVAGVEEKLRALAITLERYEGDIEL